MIAAGRCRRTRAPGERIGVGRRGYQIGLAALLLVAACGQPGAAGPAADASPARPSAAQQMLAATRHPPDAGAAAPAQSGSASTTATPGSALIARGLAIANATPQNAPRYVGGKLSCANCHVDAGRRADAWPWLGTASRYPEYDPRAGHEISLADRIRECFLRSENGTAPPDGDPVLESLLAYIDSLASTTTSHPPATRSADTISPANRIPIAQLPPTAGEGLYAQRCAVCHGAGGAGTGDIPPLWGPASFNQGAGAARVYALAGFIRTAMPLDAPGTLTDAEAQQLAAFIDAQPRPEYAGMAQDYPDGNVPVDAVYYPARATPTPVLP